MIQDLIKNKNVLMAFSDPAGAKQVLSLAAKCGDQFSSAIAISDRVYPFYQDFGISVEDYSSKTPHEWLIFSQARVLITGTSVPLNLEIPLIMEALKLGVMSISFIDHWTNMARRFKTPESLVLPDWICVIDDRARQIAIEDGIPAEKILVTGNPYYDFIALWKPKINRGAFLMSMGLPPDALYVLYAPEPLSTFGLEKKYGFTELDGIKKIYDAFFPVLDEKLFIIIKGHPNQRHEVFVDYISQKQSSYMKYFPDLDISTCSYFSEAVLGFFSNSLIEAKIMGKLVIRPLMMMSDVGLDPLKDMESPCFLSFYEQNKFVNAVRSFARDFPLST